VTARWLSVVGIGEGGLDDLSTKARALIDGAEVLVGGARHLAMIDDDGRKRIPWRAPLLRVVDDIQAFKGRSVCVMATGDPMFFGIGATLIRHIPISQMTIVPASSAFSLACARLGWPMADVEMISLHARPLDQLNVHLQTGARLLLLSRDGKTPGKVAKALVAGGFGASRMWVFEHMDGTRERLVEGTAATWRRRKIADLNTIAVACVADAGTMPLSRVPGLPDDAFAHDGQITKSQVRAATLAALVPLPGQFLWDVGAGSGAIAIEWMRAAPGARAVAIERNSKRVRLITANASKLGVPGLQIVTGEAPAVLDGLAKPDAVFIGGGGDDALFRRCWRALASGGRLVVNVVTLEGEEAVLRWRRKVGGDVVRIAVSRAAPVGQFAGWQPLRTVTQFLKVKP
jgi:precorrin-6B C5,15-methyltransferase / cobalt-precorrin-6B C5,C15-methyltransferase